MLRLLRSALPSSSAWLIATGLVIGLFGWGAIYQFQVAPISNPMAWLTVAAVALACLFLVSALFTAIVRKSQGAAVLAWLRAHPRSIIAACALCAVAASWYPVIFGGRSITGPGYARTLVVYDTDAALPGLPPASSPNQGADIGVLPWALIPNHFVVQEAILHDHEWPFWNRYAYSGSMLLGQMQSNVGDPLQLFVWLARGGAWGWDCKYLAAKFLFCLCIGLIAYRCTGSLSAGALAAVLNAFLGAFMRTFSHPEFFVLTAAPVILLCAAKLLESDGWRRFGWTLAWAGACMTALYSGAVKGGALECGTMTSLGWLYVLLHCPEQGQRRKMLLSGLLLVLGFVAINLPLLWPFILFRDSVYHGTNIATSTQPLHQILGLFDFLFYRNFPGYGTPIAPATLVHLPLVLFGLFYLLKDRSHRAGQLLLTFSALLAAIIFGALPGRLVDQVPILGRIGHLDRQLSYQLAGVCLPLLAAFGWCFIHQTAGQNRFLRFYLLMLACAIALLFWQATQNNTPPWTSSWRVYAWIALGAALLAPLFLAATKRLPRLNPTAAFLAFVLAASPAFARNVFLHEANWGTFFMVPGPRPDLGRTSPAIDQLILNQRDSKGPSRTIGTRFTIFGNYGSIWGFEDLRGYNPMVNHAYDAWLDHSGMIESPRVANWVIAVTNPDSARPLLNILGVHQLASMPYMSEPGGYPVSLRADLTNAQNPSAWPRAFFVSGALAADTVDEFWRLARRFSETPFVSLNRGVLTAAHEAPLEVPSPIITARDYQLSSNRSAFLIDASSAGWAFLAETHWPGHVRATVNGVPVPVESANGALQAVRIPKAGTYRIVFHYIPDSWEYAAGIGLAGLCLWLGWGLILAWHSLRRAKT